MLAAHLRKAALRGASDCPYLGVGDEDLRREGLGDEGLRDPGDEDLRGEDLGGEDLRDPGDEDLRDEDLDDGKKVLGAVGSSSEFQESCRMSLGPVMRHVAC
jgi:hypothetical protein